MRKVALYGGSFDPPHIGHEAIIKALQNLDYIDDIVVMPTFLNPFKDTFFAPAKLRLKWLKDIFSSTLNVKVSSFEVDKKEKVPTIETVKHLIESYEKIYLVIGADNLKNLKEWYKFSELNKLVTFIIITRDDVKVPQNFIKIELQERTSSSSLRKKIDKSKLSIINSNEIEKYYKENNAR